MGWQDDEVVSGGGWANDPVVKQAQKPAVDNRNLFPAMIGGRFAPDLLMGLRQTWDAAAQLGARGAESLANKFGGSPLLTSMRQDTERVNQEALDEYNKTYAPDSEGGASLARGVGQALATGPFMPAMKAAGLAKGALTGAGIGGASAGLTPVYGAGEDFWKQKGKDAAVGAAVGGALGTAGGMLGKAAPTAGAQELQAAGVHIPPGRAAGGVVGRMEEGAESIPVVGDSIRGAHRRAVEDFNRATFDKVLEPIGEKLSANTLGREAVKESRVKISAAYESVLGKIGRVDLDRTFSDEGVKIAQMTAELGDQSQKQFMAVLKNRVMARITPAGTMSAETMKRVDSDLGKAASMFHKSQDSNTRGLGDAVQEVQASLRRAVERSAGPELAKEVQAANNAWALWVRTADASSRAGSKEGVFSPAALRGAVSKADKRGFREGDALLQDWAQKGEAVLGPKVPDSGTPFRLASMAGIGGWLLDPSVAAGGAALMLPYTKIGGKAATALASKAGDAAAMAPYLGLLAPGLLGQR